MREDVSGCGRWPDQLLLRISHPSRATARCTIEPLPPHPPLPPGGFSGGNSFGMQSGQNASFGLLPGGADFWISVVLVQARFDYRFFLFAKFPVIEPRFTIKFIQLGPNSRRSSALSLGSASRISALIMAEIYRGQQGAASKRLGKKIPCSPSSILVPITPIINRNWRNFCTFRLHLLTHDPEFFAGLNRK